MSPSDERAAIALLTLSEGVGSDIHGRYAFLAFTAAVGATTFVAVRQAAGMLTAVLLTVGGSIALVAGVMVFVAVRREEKRKEQSLVTGTLIPPGYAAIVTGEQYEPGEWVPPGFKVELGPGSVSDDKGNSVSGTNSRIYGGVGNTVIGSASQIGEKPY
ncbi:MAG: hypothetical protein ACYDDU_05305 [Dermatophilaceae bacterium]